MPRPEVAFGSGRTGGGAMSWGILAGLLAGALWGLVFVAPRMTPGLSSLDLAAGRFLSYGLVSRWSCWPCRGAGGGPRGFRWSGPWV